jgi:hypothetical protein
MKESLQRLLHGTSYNLWQDEPPGIHGSGTEDSWRSQDLPDNLVFYFT